MRALLTIVLVLPLLAGCRPESSGTDSPLAVAADWSATAQEHRGHDGQRFVYECPPGGQSYTVWGTDVYTDDSSVCNAAVHAGLFTQAAGGRVAVEIRPAQDAYAGSTRNGFTTMDYGAWGGSFVVARP